MTIRRQHPRRAPAPRLQGGQPLHRQRRGGGGGRTRRAAARTGHLPRRLGPYLLFDTVGEGGMADLYLAHDGAGAERRLVVIKEVELAHAAAAERRPMLLREAEVAKRLEHRNIVRVDELADGGTSLYLVMEYVEGLDLRELLRRCARRGSWPSLPLALYIVRELLAALDGAHRASGPAGEPAGVVHRDVSPANVLMSFAGQVKLCDFGLAAPARPAAAEAPPIEGKAGYMSPEQARGESVDPRADVFAAGIILWELCARRRMYKARAGQRLLQVAARAEVPELPTRDLPRQEELDEILRRALAPRRDDRYPTAGALLDDLAGYADRAELRGAPEGLASWLREHFVSADVTRRRARARSLSVSEDEPASCSVRPAARPAAADPRRYPNPLRTLVLHALISCVVTLGLLWLVALTGPWA